MAQFKFDMQSFLNSAGFNQPPEAEIPGGMPVKQPTLPNWPGASIPVPNAYQEEYPSYDEGALAEVEQPSPTLEAFRQNVMNPPKRTQMTYPKNTLAGLQKGLELLAEDSPTERNRVYIDGKAHQRAQWFKDPVTGEKRFITAKDPSFADQVLKTLPAAMSPAVDILNQQREDELFDWDLKNKGLAAASKAESDFSLAEQRRAQAEYTTGRGGREQEKIDISRMTAEEKARVSQLSTLSDTEKIQLLQQGRISLAELNAAEAMKRVVAQQEGATTRTGMQQAGAGQRTAATVAGAKERVGMQQEGANYRVGQQQAGQDARTQAGIEGRLRLKQTPSGGAGSTSQLPTQQIKAAQFRASQAIQDHPEWEDYLTIDQNGMVHIEAPSTSWYDQGPDRDTHAAIKSYLREGMPTQAPTIAPYQPTTTTPPAATTKSTTTTPPKASDTSKQPQVMRKTMPDGTVVERTVPSQHIQAAKAQGFR